MADFTASIIQNVDGVGAPADPVARSAPKMTLRFDAGNAIVIPYAPEESDVGNIAGRWVETDRPGTEPLLEWGGRQLRTVSAEFTMVWPDMRSIEPLLNELSTMAERPSKVTIAGWHGLADGTWRITAMDIRTTRLTPENKAARASVSLTLTRASDAVVLFGVTTPGKAVPSSTTGLVPTRPAGPPVPAPGSGTDVISGSAPGGAGSLIGGSINGAGSQVVQSIGAAIGKAVGDALGTSISIADVLRKLAIALDGSPDTWPRYAQMIGVLDPRKPVTIDDLMRGFPGALP